MIDQILRQLSPEVLRAQFQEFDEERERFIPKVLMTSSYEEMMEELGRFVCRVRQRWFHAQFPWPMDRALNSVRVILERRLGDGLHPKSGEYAAMRISRNGDQGGIRHLLDIVADALLDEALRQYVEHVVLQPIYALDPQSSLRLAKAYGDTYPECAGWEVDSPASIALRWRQVIHYHARAALRHGA